MRPLVGVLFLEPQDGQPVGLLVLEHLLHVLVVFLLVVYVIVEQKHTISGMSLLLVSILLEK